MRASVEEVVLLGRRGPAQAAFSPKEIQEIDELPNVDVIVRKQDAALDALSEKWVAEAPRSHRRNVDFLQARASAGDSGAAGRLNCRFLVAPVELHGDGNRLTAVTVEHMQLVADDNGTPRPRATGEREQLEVDLLFKAIGYRGEPVPGVPFEQRKGIVPNDSGRVLEQDGGPVRVGHYAAGWCKRGPTGLIGTNSIDAKETVSAMCEDREQDNMLAPPKSDDDVVEILAERGVDVVSWTDWQRLDAWEREQGEQRGRLRHKLTSVDEMMTVIRELRSANT